MQENRAFLLHTAALIAWEKPRQKAVKPLKCITEREGFEPSEPCGSLDFKSSAFDHSATSPGGIASQQTPEA